jgi:uncharacterized coiled-coil protein SlyX
MKSNLISRLSILLLLSQSAFGWFNKPQAPSFINDADIEILKADFDTLANGQKTIQEVKAAQSIIELIHNDSAGQKHAAQWQKTIQKIDVVSLSSIHDHPQEIQAQINAAIAQAKEHTESIAHKIKTEMAASTPKLPMQQALDTVLTTVNGFEEKMKQEAAQRMALEERTKNTEMQLAHKDQCINELRTEVATLRTTVESSANYYQTKLDNSNAMLQKTKLELAQTSKELLKTEAVALKNQERTKKIEVAMQQKVDEKEQRIQHLQTQLESLDSQVSTLAQDLGAHRRRFEEKEKEVAATDWPVLQTLMRLEKNKQF